MEAIDGVEFPADEQSGKHKRQFNHDQVEVFSHLHRLDPLRCRCRLHLQDSMGARHALELLVEATGGVEFPADEQYGKHKRQYNQDGS